MFSSLTHASKLTFCLGVKSVGITTASTINKLFTSSSLRTEKPLRHEAFTRSLDHWQTADIANCKASKGAIVDKIVETFRFAFSESFSTVFYCYRAYFALALQTTLIRKTRIRVKNTTLKGRVAEECSTTKNR